MAAEGQLKKEKPLATIDEDEKSFNLPKSWEWSVLGQLFLKVSDEPHFLPKYVEKKDCIPFISARNIIEVFLNDDNTSRADSPIRTNTSVLSCIM